MKNLFFCLFCGIFAVIFTSSCETAKPIMIRNSAGYEADSQREEIRSLESEQPEWFGSSNWAKWQEKKEKEGAALYFLGESKLTLRDLEKNGKSLWTEQDATEAAWKDAMRQVTDYIALQISTTYSERIKEAQKQSGMQLNGTTVAELKQFQAQEESLLQFESSSSVQFDGLRIAERFTQTFEKTTRRRRKITATYCWIVYSIPKDDITKARQKIEDERQTVQDEKKQQERIKEEEDYFISLTRQYEARMKELNGIEFSEDEKQFGEKYNELLNIRARIQTLSRLKDRDDEFGRQYKNMLAKIGDELHTHNPTDRQRRLIESLQRQVADKDGRIDELRREQQVRADLDRDTRIDELRADSQRLVNEKDRLMDELGLEREERAVADRAARIEELRVELQRLIAEQDKLMDELRLGKTTQTVILTYPQRPNETKVTGANIFAANNMVSNRDYISFTSHKGINNLSRGEWGLDVPAILVTWNDAALYCNWLSRLYGYTPCYTESNGQITDYSKMNNGYRLPEYQEIRAVLDSSLRVINENELIQTAIWSSDGTPAQRKFYKLSSGTGAASDRLMEQATDSAASDMDIGYRIVRNAE